MAMGIPSFASFRTPKTTFFSGPGGFRLDWPQAEFHLVQSVSQVGLLIYLKNDHLSRKPDNLQFFVDYPVVTGVASELCPRFGTRSDLPEPSLKFVRNHIKKWPRGLKDAFERLKRIKEVTKPHNQ